MLNEMFFAEKDASKVSTYTLNADGVDIGRFKSSGIIVSTGTGSSGWLYGAKRLSNTNVSDIAHKLKDHVRDMQRDNKLLEQSLVDSQFVEQLANQMSKETHFSPESK